MPFVKLDTATLRGIADNATALLKYAEKSSSVQNEERRDDSEKQQRFHFGELLNYVEALKMKLERAEGNSEAATKELLPPRARKQQLALFRGQFWAVGLELFNEAGDILLLPKLLAVDTNLFYASLAALCLSLVLRMFNGLLLRKRIKPNKHAKYFCALLLNLLEPNSGMQVLKSTLQDREDGAEVWDVGKTTWVLSDKDPVAVMSHVDLDANNAEVKNLLVMVLGEDIPESIISVIYAIKVGTNLDFVFAISALGTILHMIFQLWELRVTAEGLPGLKKMAEGRDKTFAKETTTDKEVVAFAEVHGDAVLNASLFKCSQITDAAVVALAEHCPNIQNIYLNGCDKITDAAVVALVKHCPNIQIIHLDWCDKITDAAVVALAKHCPNIQTINLNGCGKITDTSVVVLAEHCPSIQTINLSNCGKITDAAVVALAEHCPSIQTINLSNCDKISDAAVVTLAEHCPNIQTINFNGCKQITDTAVVVLAKHCPNIQTINLNGCDKITDAAVVALAEHCPSIQTINLGYCDKITDAAVVAIAKHCPDIQTINLNGCGKITDAAVVTLAEHCPNIQTISNIRPTGRARFTSRNEGNLSFFRAPRAISDAAVVTLAEHCPSIQTINLSNCGKITDAAVVALAKHCPSIQTIYLNGCGKITDAAVVALAEHCPSIQTIYLSNCKKISDAAVVALAEHCPDIQTIFLYGCDKITDTAVVALAKHCTSIQTIGLSSCKQISQNHRKKLDTAAIDVLRSANQQNVRAGTRGALELTAASAQGNASEARPLSKRVVSQKGRARTSARRPRHAR